jgi:SAM-dependent methyltransferase
VSRAEEPESRIVEAWDRNAGPWTEAVRNQAVESRRVATDQAIVEEVLACPGRRVLDAGCGEGWLARRLAQAGLYVTGFDSSRALGERATTSGGARFVTLSYDEFELRADTLGTFDIVVCNFSLLGERTGPLLAALRAAAPAGRLVIQTLHPLASAGSLPYADGWREESFAGMPGQWQAMPWYFRTLGSWVDQVVSADWAIERLREPLHPDTGQPLSLIIVARAAT